MIRDSDRRIAKRKSAGATDDDWLWLVHEEPMAGKMGYNAFGITRCLRHGCMADSASRLHERRKGEKLHSVRHGVRKVNWWISRGLARALIVISQKGLVLE
jgi:hypothetical protein